MPQDSSRPDSPAPARPGVVPVQPATRQDAARPAPDLHIEEIEERHIPKDRNIFDK